MSEPKMEFLSYEEALQIVAAIQEEEDIDRRNHRILTVYNYDDKEICWFDYDEVIADTMVDGKKAGKEAVQDYILRHIPAWALDI